MQKNLKKLVSIFTVLMLVVANLMPTIAYAADGIQNSDTTIANVKFDAKINEGYSAECDISSNATLNLSLSVLNTGYLKDAKITLGNNNYKLGSVGSNYVKSINNNVIELNEINAGENAVISIPISINKEDIVNKDILNRESTVTLNAKYVNEKGKEVSLTKTLKENLKWVANAEETVSQKLTRFIKVNGKTLVSFDVTDAVKDHLIPAVSKTIKVITPKINGQFPETYTVSNLSYHQTYEEKNGVATLTITKDVKEPEEGKTYWNTDDTFGITLLYNTQGNEKSILQKVSAEAVLLDGNTARTETENESFATVEEVGSIINLENVGTTELSKGYLYSNLNRTDKLSTSFNSTYKINVGIPDITDTIKVTEQNSEIVNERNEKVLDATILESKVRVDELGLRRVLGEEGSIVVKDSTDTVLGTLNKTNLELNVSTDKLVFETSNVQKQGEITINVEKSLKNNDTLTFEDIKNFKQLNNYVNVEAIKDNITIQNNVVVANVALTEPTSKASINTSRDSLSTVVVNENVELSVELDSKDINSALYKDPQIKITLPEEVNAINIKNVNLIYNNGLQVAGFNAQGNVINVTLNGTQSEYGINGSRITIKADISLNNTALSRDTKIYVEVLNNMFNNTAVNECNIKIVAPSDFVTINKMTIGDKSVTALENDEQLINIGAKGNAKTASVVGKVINNIPEGINGLTIVGKIPNGEGVTTTLSGPVSVPDMAVYYSNNINEAINGTGWTQEYSNTAKAFKIVGEGLIGVSYELQFKYNVIIPAGLDYDKNAVENYTVYYNNNGTEGNTLSVKEAKAVGFTTGTKPNLEVKTEVKDTYTGRTILNNGEVSEGEYITYKASIKNTGSSEQTNVKYVLTVPSALVTLDTDEELQAKGFTKTNGKQKIYNAAQYEASYSSMGMEVPTVDAKVYTKTFERIAAGETISVEFNFDDMARVSDNEEYNYQQIETEVNSNEIEQKAYNNYVLKVVQGTIEVYGKINKNTIESEKPVLFVELTNVNNSDKENIETTITLPNGVVMENNDEYQDINTYNIRQQNNKLVMDNVSLSGYGRASIRIPLNTKNLRNMDSKVVIESTYNNSTKKVELSIEGNNAEELVTARQTISVNKDKIYDTEIIELYTEVKNESSEDRVIYFNNIPSYRLNVINNEIIIDNQVIKTIDEAIVYEYITIPSGKSVIVKTKASIESIEDGEEVVIKNKPIIKMNNRDLDVNEISFTVIGTGSNGNIVENIKGSISGFIWFDRNNNGRKDDNEETFSNIKLVLFDVKKQDLVKKGDNVVTVTTDNNGRYSFDDLENGTYVVIAEYDVANYGIGSYKEPGVIDTENSNFVTSMLDGKEVAATDNLEIANSNIYNVNLGLVTKNLFDLKLDKLVSKVTVVKSNAKDNRVYEFNSNVAKIELPSKDIDSNNVIVEYKIKISNIGRIAGYAKSIVDYLPEGMSFNTELNSGWYLKDGNAYNTSLANTIINPGETKEITLVLTKKINGQNMGLFRNTAEIAATYNEQGIEDVNSVAGNKKDGENDISSADTFILISTGKEILSIAGITLGVLAIVAFGVVMVKKHVINKMV